MQKSKLELKTSKLGRLKKKKIYRHMTQAFIHFFKASRSYVVFLKEIKLEKREEKKTH